MVLAARQSGERMDWHEAHRLSGGGFFDDLKKFVNKISRGVQSVSGVVGDIAGAIPLPIAQQIAQGARAVQGVAGSVRGATGGRISGGGMSRRRM